MPCQDFSALKSLKVLDLSDNRLNFIGDADIVNLPNDTHIIVKNNELVSLRHNSAVCDKSSDVEPHCNYLLLHDLILDTKKHNYTLASNESTIICTSNGAVVSLKNIVGENIPENCTTVTTEAPHYKLQHRNISSFEANWYRLSDTWYGSKLWLENNNISDIGFINYLPEQVTFVNLQGNNIKSIKKYSVKNVHIKHYHLQDNKIETIEKGTFGDSKSLKTLYLIRNKLSDVSFISSLPDTLIVLDLSSNNISYLPNDIFSKLTHLCRLDLGNNKLVDFEPRAFKRLYRLLNLNLAENNIAIVKKYQFEDFYSIRELYLQPSKTVKTQVVEEGFALNMNALKKLVIGPVKELNNCVFFGLPCDANVTITRNTLETFRPKLFKSCPSD